MTVGNEGVEVLMKEDGAPWRLTFDTLALIKTEPP